MAAVLVFLLVSALVAESLQEVVYIDKRSLTSIPEELVSPTVTYLHAESNDITELESIPRLPTLESLYLNRNRLYAFPYLENVADTLVSLNLEYNNISYIASNRLDILTHLTTLYLTQNSISSIPDVSGPSETLTYLKLDYNQFTTFPDWEFLGKSLTYLNFLDNGISEVTEDMFRNMTKLTGLYLYGNSLTSAKLSLPGSLNLTTLDLTGNALTEFPNVGNITTLTSLKLGENLLTNIPEEIFSRLTSLQTLYLTGNQITIDRIPDVVGPNGTLTTLTLSNNPISEMPRWANLSKALVSLSITTSKISKLTDEDLDYYPVLKSLDLSTSNISEFPYLPRNGPRLTSLNLYHNKIEVITEAQIQPLQNLTTIKVSANRLTSIPNFCFAKFIPNFVLDLRYNYFVCDTSMVWALGARKAIPSYNLYISSCKCSQPPHLYGQYVESVPIEQMENPIGAKFIDREYYPIEPPFNCYLPIIRMEASLSSLTCAFTCSQSTSCLIFGYLSDVGDDLNAPGICAITSLSGTALETNLNFKWFAPK